MFPASVRPAGRHGGGFAPCRSFSKQAQDEMVQIPGGTFAMGSDRALSRRSAQSIASRSTGSGWTRHRSRIANSANSSTATNYVTFAEVAPRAEDYPGALPHMLKAGSLVFRPPPGQVDLSNWSLWWEFRFGANWRHPYGRGTWIKGLDDHPVVHVAYRDAEAYANGPARNCRRRPSGSSPPAAVSKAPSSRGATSSRRRRADGQHLAGRLPA